MKTPKSKQPANVLWELCKQIIRARYPNECYTCGTKGLQASNWQTGHFIPKSVCSTELAYDLTNLRPQCMPCNKWKSGNWPAFEARLIEEEGQEYVDELKARNQATKGKKYGTPWLKAKILEYEAILASIPPRINY